MRSIWLALASVVFSGAAVAQDPPADPARYARLTLDIGPGLPVVVESAAPDAGTLARATIRNAEQRLTVAIEARLDRGGSVRSVRFALPPYDSEVSADAGFAGTRPVAPAGFADLFRSGIWTIERTDCPVAIPFTTEPIEGPHERFDPIAGPVGDAGEPADFAGRWRVRFEGDNDDAVGVFEVDRETGLATGTFLTTTGDYGHLDGRVDGALLRLSTFDGAHAFLFHAEMQPDGTLSGTFWSGTWWEQAWTAQRDNSVSIGDGFARTSATVVDFDTPEVGNLAFTSPDLVRGPVLLSGLLPAGEPRLLYVFGTWCPNCSDATAFIKELHETYGPRGLRIGAIAFERNLDTAPERVAAYRAHHGTDWGIVIGGLSDKARAGEALPILDRVRSYPTAVFINRDGTIEDVYSGFSGPATGEAHTELRTQWIERVEAILAE